MDYNNANRSRRRNDVIRHMDYNKISRHDRTWHRDYSYPVRQNNASEHYNTPVVFVPCGDPRKSPRTFI